MADPYYSRRPPPSGPEIERLSASFAKLFRSGVGDGGFPGIHSNHQHNLSGHHGHGNHVITQQPFGSQVSNNSSFGMGIPMTWCPPPMSPPTQFLRHPQHLPLSEEESCPQPAIGIPLPGLDLLHGIPFIKVADSGLFSGSYTCSPSYRILNRNGERMLHATTTKLFCPFDARMKTVRVKDSNDDCIFQINFLPSICECDSEEKRCFAVFSPLYENPFGAILFEAGQIKYSLRIINALEGETFAVQFLSSTDISIVGADTRILAIINILQKRGEKQKYTLTLTEEISTANKALFIACILTLDLVSCEATCSKCICLTPFLVACLTIFGLTMASTWDGKPEPNRRP